MNVARLTGPRGRIYSLTAEEVEAVRAQLSPAQQALAATEPNALARYPLRVTLRQGEHVLLFDERDVAALFRQVHAGAAATISRKLTPGEEKALLALYLWELAGEQEPLRNGESLIPDEGDSLRGFYITIKYPTLHALVDHLAGDVKTRHKRQTDRPQQPQLAAGIAQRHDRLRHQQ